jgi:DNA-binding PadR family transcriptional regulator
MLIVTYDNDNIVVKEELMSIKYVILGYLSWQPLSGYDLKKIIAESETLPWSANNNQIYKALVQLHDDDLVTKKIEDQAGAPARHVYTITDKGRKALNEWVGGEPDLPQTKKAFLHQLMWADSLNQAELDELLEGYKEVVADKLFLLRVQADRKPNMPERTERESYLWQMIYKNWIQQFEIELDWVRQIRSELNRNK